MRQGSEAVDHGDWPVYCLFKNSEVPVGWHGFISITIHTDKETTCAQWLWIYLLTQADGISDWMRMGKGWSKEKKEQGEDAPLSVSQSSNPLQPQRSWLVLGVLTLLSLALESPSRNADSKGQFPSRFNDPCDFSVRNVSSEAAQPVSPGLHLFQNPEGGPLPSPTFTTATGDRRLE